MINFTTSITHKATVPCTVVSFELEGGVAAPENLAAMVAAAPPVDGADGVILTGRGPVWLFAALTHHYHATQWVATNDPRLGGGVVVERHSPDAPAVGDIVKFEL